MAARKNTVDIAALAKAIVTSLNTFALASDSVKEENITATALKTCEDLKGAGIDSARLLHKTVAAEWKPALPTDAKKKVARENQLKKMMNVYMYAAVEQSIATTFAGIMKTADEWITEKEGETSGLAPATKKSIPTKNELRSSILHTLLADDKVKPADVWTDVASEANKKLNNAVKLEKNAKKIAALYAEMIGCAVADKNETLAKAIRAKAKESTIAALNAYALTLA